MIDRIKVLQDRLWYIDGLGYPGSESSAFKAYCKEAGEIEKELKSLRAANEKINGMATNKAEDGKS